MVNKLLLRRGNRETFVILTRFLIFAVPDYNKLWHIHTVKCIKNYADIITATCAGVPTETGLTRTFWGAGNVLYLDLTTVAQEHT